MTFTLPGGLVAFHRMKQATSPVQIKTAAGGGIATNLKSFPNTRPSFTQVGMSESKKGHFSTGLTQEEQEYLEPALGLEKGQLSSIIPDMANPEKVRNCYWLQPRATVELPVHGPRTLDLSVAHDYLQYKVLSQMQSVAVGMKEYNAKSEAVFVLIKEEDVQQEKFAKVSSKKKAYQHITDWTSTQYSDYLWAQGEDPRHLNPDALEGKVGEAIEKNPDYFLKQVTDKVYKEKVQIGELVRLGVLECRGSAYKFNGAPLADSLEEMVDFMQDKQKQGQKIEILKELKARK